MTNQKILFVCTGNVFRSLSAEYCLKSYLTKSNIKNILVSSAGIVAKPENPDPVTIKTLEEFGVLVDGHKQTKLTAEIVKDYDLIIAMAENHQEFIRTNFNIEVPLFNELTINKKTSVLDLDDVIEDYKTNRKATEEFIRITVKHIFNSTPLLITSLEV